MRDVSWSFVILSCIAVFIVATNAIVCVFVVTNVRLRTFTNGFLVSLAVSDILTGGLLFPVHLSGPDSAVASSEGYLIAFVLLSGVGNICLVTWDRYIAVAKPFKYKKIVQCHFTKLIIVTWATALVVSLLPLTWQTDSNVVIHKVYLFCLMGFFIVIPYAAVFYAYYQISQHLKKHRQKLRRHSTTKALSSRKMKAEAKVTKVFLAIVIIFVLSWLPILYMTTVTSVNRPDLSPVALQKVSLITVALSSLVNPLLYAFMKEDFRQEFKKVASRQRRSSVSASAIELKTSTAACITETSRKYLQLP
ncbi:adenosine receptor A2b-like [Oculina patagonica]